MSSRRRSRVPPWLSSLLAGSLLAGLCALLPLRAAAQEIPEISAPIIVTDDLGGKQVLELGIDPNATSGNDGPKFGEGQAPPFPPNPSKVVARFIDADVSGVTGIPDGTGMNVDIRQGGTDFSGQKVHEIKFATGSDATEVTFRWDLPAGVTGTIKDKFGGAVYGPKDMSGSGSFTVNAGDPFAIITLTYSGSQKPPHRRAIPGTDGTGNDTGWRLLAPPSQAVRGDLQDDLSFDVDSGHLLHTWSGGGPNAWSAATSASDPLQRGKGFVVYFFDDSVDEIPSNGLPLDVSNEGESQSSNVTVSGLSTSNRFHVLGNPYNVAFDLSSLAGGDLESEGFQKSVRVWNSETQQFETVMQGSSGDEIAAWEGFVVERTTTGQGASSLTFNASGRQSGAGTLSGGEASSLIATSMSASSAKSGRAAVDLKLGVEDESGTVEQSGATVLLDEEASAGWDGYDATRIAPPGETAAALTFPTERDDRMTSRSMASQPRPDEDEARTIPVSVRSDVSGTATIQWPETAREQVPDRWTVKLEDKKTGTQVDLRNGGYEFTPSNEEQSLTTPKDARFRLHVTSAAAIPVELTRFEAQTEEERVRLTWQTASEQSNAGFYVQRSAGTDGRWKRLGFVESKASGGTTAEPKRYRFRDTKRPYTADTLAYRLRQIDTDGTAHLSEAVTVALGAPVEAKLKPPFPNPASRRATLRFSVPEPTTVRVAVYDLLGRRVTTVAEGAHEAGRHEAALPVASLSPGLYFVRLRAAGITQTRKLTVTH